LINIPKTVLTKKEFLFIIIYPINNYLYFNLTINTINYYLIRLIIPAL
jgi:hypothetical protein